MQCQVVFPEKTFFRIQEDGCFLQQSHIYSENSGFCFVTELNDTLPQNSVKQCATGFNVGLILSDVSVTGYRRIVMLVHWCINCTEK